MSTATIERQRRDLHVRMQTRITRDAQSGAVRFRGHAAVFDQPSVPMGGMREFIAPGAMDATMAGDPDVRFLHNHDPNWLLARTTIPAGEPGSCALSLDGTGLATDSLWVPTARAEEVAQLVECRAITGMSFGFWIVRGHRETRNGEQVYVIDEVELDGGDVSTVVYPAYPQTDAELRALAQQLDPPARESFRFIDPGAPSMPTATTAPAPAQRTIPQPSYAQLQILKRAAVRRERQQRDLHGWTFTDLWPLLDEAVCEACSSEDFNAYWYVWLVDLSDTWCVYYDKRPGASEASYFQVDFTVDEQGTVQLGTPVAVNPKTTYVPDADDAGETEDEPAVGLDPDMGADGDPTDDDGADRARPSDTQSTLITRERRLLLMRKVI